MGRLVKDPDVRYSQGQESMAIARYTLAVDRAIKKDREQTADFISCVAFGKNGEFAEKYLHKGTKIAIEGRIQTGSYEKDGHKVYTTDIVVEHHEFCESRNASGTSGNSAPDADGFVNVPDSVDDEALPFN
jgi:single-strand DNA-binding protein